MIHVIGLIEVADGKRDEFLAAFKELVSTVCAEEGCIDYGPSIDADTPLDWQLPAGENVLVVIEKWESVAALDAHMKAPHMQAFLDKMSAVVQSVKAYILQPA